MKVKKGFEIREVCGIFAIVAVGIENIDFNRIISMNETSAHIWKSVMEKEFTVEDMVEALMQEYEVDKETAFNDCTTLANQWFEAGIIER